MQRNKRKVVKGTVVSNKMDKTVAVEVIKKIRHPKYEKLMTKKKKYFAHDEKNALEIGQEVSIMQSRAFSKKKRWIVI